MEGPAGSEKAPGRPIEDRQRRLKCPQCGAGGVAASRRRTPWEEWSALWGRGYFRCANCNNRFSAYCGFGDSQTYYEKMFVVRRAAGRIALICGVILLVVVVVVGIDYLINGFTSGPGFGGSPRK